MITNDVNYSYGDLGKTALHILAMDDTTKIAAYPGLAGRLKDRREELGLVQRAVAEACAVSRVAVTQWEGGISEPEPVRHGNLVAVLKTNRAWLLQGIGNPDLTDDISAQIPIDLPVPSGNKDLPLMGTGVGGDDHDFSLNGEIIEFVRRPPGLEGITRAFAVYVVGDSMYPRFTEGEPVFVHPGRPPRIGDDVLIELFGTASSNGPAFIKRLVRRQPATVMVTQFNPPKDIPIDQALIKSMYRIMTAGELFGI